jgi:protease I
MEVDMKDMRTETKSVALFLEAMVNEQEFIVPRYRLDEAGFKVVVAATEAKREYKSKFGMTFVSDAAFRDLDPAGFDGVIVPGGYAPDLMRKSPEALAFVRAMNSMGRLVAFICHAGWVPASAGVLKGRRCTSCVSIRDDLVNAGGLWEDSAVVVDGNLVSSRTPDDLSRFMAAVVGILSAQK